MKLAFKRPADPPMPEGIVMVMNTLGKNPRYWIDNELTTNELAGIGAITVQWAHLEHMLLVRTMQLAKQANIALPEDAKKLSFSKRLRAWRILYEQVVTDKKERRAMDELHGRIAAAEDNRHKITHGLWDYDRRNPSRLRASSFRVPFDFERHFDMDRFYKLYRMIAEANFKLHFPKGPASLERPYAFASRSFLQAISGPSPPDPRRRRATPPKRKDPR